MTRDELKTLNLPDSPGVYLFTKGKGRGKKILYIGKATSLRDRVRSYFDDDLIATRGPRIVDMVTESDGLMHEPTPTVLEALVREAALIKEYLPKANTEGKDDKTFLYAYITDEHIPRILTARGKDIDFENSVIDGVRAKDIFGPFPSGGQLKVAMKLIRKIFPFYDTRKPVGVVSKHQSARVEFNRQIGQYPQAEANHKEYLRQVRNVGLYLGGKVKGLRETLEREMKQYAKAEDFEEAQRIKRQLFALDHVQDVALIREDRAGRPAGPRIEAFDTAHISGTNTVAVLTVIEDGAPDKKGYRIFNIKSAKNDDLLALREVMSRRLSHDEWELPKAFVIDGGKTHKKTAEEVVAEFGMTIPVVAVVKDEKHRPREVIGAQRAGISESDAVLVNSEAHRFALTSHRKARTRALRNT